MMQFWLLSAVWPNHPDDDDLCRMGDQILIPLKDHDIPSWRPSLLSSHISNLQIRSIGQWAFWKAQSEYCEFQHETLMISNLSCTLSNKLVRTKASISTRSWWIYFTKEICTVCSDDHFSAVSTEPLIHETDIWLWSHESVSHIFKTV